MCNVFLADGIEGDEPSVLETEFFSFFVFDSDGSCGDELCSENDVIAGFVNVFDFIIVVEHPPPLTS